MKYIFLLFAILLAFISVRVECEADPGPEALALAEGIKTTEIVVVPD